MIKKTVLSMVAFATLAGSMLATASDAQAQYRRYPSSGYDDNNWGGQPDNNWGRRPDNNWNNPPPPPQKHHHNGGRDIAVGVAAGLIGGIIGGAIANQGQVYAAPPPPPPPRCWFEDREVDNQYDGGSHIEQVRICR